VLFSKGMGARSEEKRLVSRVPATLAALLAVPEGKVQALAPDSNGAALVVTAAGQTFAVEVVDASAAGPVAAHAKRAADAAKAIRKRAIPVVAVPFMGDSGKQACERAGVSWFDFSGNAHIIAPGIRVIVDGRPNQFRARGRPASAFAPKSSRVARYLLMHPDETVIQRDIAHATGVSEGFVSRIVARLEEEHYVGRDEGGALRVKDPRLLLEAWREQYRFSKHTIIQGHVAARSGDALARQVGDTLEARSVEHAATGLAAAWQLTRFATFRIATFYLDADPDTALKDDLGFREDVRGANLWLVVPNDAGVFQGAQERNGLRCVHPVQVYLDLKEHPERASEAAERLRAEFLSW
jgi:hypothetical protein